MCGVEMELKKLHMGTVVFGWDSMDEVGVLLSTSFGGTAEDVSCELFWLFCMRRANAYAN